MERRETSRALSPLIIHSPFHTTREIGTKVNWLLTGVGRAYLAFCPAGERGRILERLRRSDKPEDRLAHDPSRLERIFAETRKRGYGIRDPSFVGGPYGFSNCAMAPSTCRTSTAVGVSSVKKSGAVAGISVMPSI